MIKYLGTILVSILLFPLLSNTLKAEKQSDETSTPSHSKSAAPDYSLVFPDNKVNRIDIQIDTTQWNSMLTDLEEKLGGPADGGGPRPPLGNNMGAHTPPPMKPGAARGGRPGGFGGPPEHGGRPMLAENDSIMPGRGRRMGMPNDLSINPSWAYCSVLFNNETWNGVGIRFRGNSSLRSTFQSGSKKFSFKLDFDQFEDEFPETKNQRFYGFKQLNLKNNFNDNTFMHEKVASDLFAEFGIVSPKTSFYEVYVDFGEGPEYFGLYTLVEEVDDTVIETNFSDKHGNLYKPEGEGASFAAGSFSKSDMNKKTNKKSKDYSDVQQLYSVLNSPLRTKKPEQWKEQLTAIFDVPIFLKWLAANTVIQNWDTYGNMTHNFYLYHDSSSEQLVWIPWDNNEAFQAGKMGGGLPLSLNNVTENWPLIRYIIDDNEWNAMYQDFVSEFSTKIFTPEKMSQTFDTYQQLISGSVALEQEKQPQQEQHPFFREEANLETAVEFLKEHVYERQSEVEQYLQQQKF